MSKLTIELTQTCSACPEQYDLTINGIQAGYFRLRHGYFTVTCPDVGGHCVYEHDTKGNGSFEEDERPRFLSAGIRECVKIYLEENKNVLDREEI